MEEEKEEQEEKEEANKKEHIISIRIWSWC